MHSDSISDMLTRIRNGLAVGKTEVLVPFSNLKERLVKILISEGYLAGVEEINSPYRSLMVHLSVSILVILTGFMGLVETLHGWGYTCGIYYFFSFSLC